MCIQSDFFFISQPKNGSSITRRNYDCAVLQPPPEMCDSKKDWLKKFPLLQRNWSREEQKLGLNYGHLREDIPKNKKCVCNDILL